jgi:hypothetical protein
MGTKRNLVLYLDKDLVAKSKALGFNLSKAFENHLKHLITQFSTCNSAKNFYSMNENGMIMVRSTGFEPVIASLEGLCPKPARRRPPLGHNSSRNKKSYRLNPDNANQRRTKTKHSQTHKIQTPITCSSR